jgi:predicted Na+-dependent transporter
MPLLLTAYRKNTVIFSNFRFGRFKEQSIIFILGVQTRLLATSLSTAGCLYTYTSCRNA